MDGRAGMGRQVRFSDQEYREIAGFRVALHEFLHGADERARELGITPQRYLLLLSVRGHRAYPAVTIGEVARALQVRQSSASLLIDRAVRDGHLNRVAGTEDRRRVHLSLTESGQQLLDTIMTANRHDLGRLNWARFGATLREAMQFQPEAAAGQ